MIASSKEKIYRDGFRCQSAKSDRDPHRVCPSKLSKKELEDLYFSLMDTNLELKRTVNMQQDNIKMLNTRVNRLITAQKSSAKENNCCAPSKAIVLEQKDTIADLKKANDRMADRIRILNMRLCSAKQFLKRCPSQGNAKCIKCCMAPPASLKNSSVSVIQSKRSASEHKHSGSATQTVPNEPLSTRTVETETEDGETENNSHNVCKENKCRTLVEELKQKVIDLQEESSKYHSEYSSRIVRLEEEMSSLQKENARVRQERATTQQGLALQARRAQQLAAELRAADAHSNDVESQLLIEKSKVAELETRVKAADIVGNAAKELEKGQKSNPNVSVTDVRSNKSPLLTAPTLDVEETPKGVTDKEREDSPLKLTRRTGVSHYNSYTDICHGRSPLEGSPDKAKHSDDSGYNDNPRNAADDEALGKINKELEKKIKILQDQLTTLKIASAGLNSEQPAKVSDGIYVEKKADESIKQGIACSKDGRCGGTKRMESERKKEQSPERLIPDIHRANEIWAKLSDDGTLQKEERIQFTKEAIPQNYNASTPSHLISPDRFADKDSSKGEAKTPKNTKINSELIGDDNELVDKIVEKGFEKSTETKIDYNSDAQSNLDYFNHDVPTQDFFRHDGITPENFRHEMDRHGVFKRDSTQDDIKDLKQISKRQDKRDGEEKLVLKGKEGVKILHSDRSTNDDVPCHSRDVYKYDGEKLRRDSKTETKDQELRENFKDIKNQCGTDISTQAQNNSDDDSMASDNIHSPVELCSQSVRLCSCCPASRRAVSLFRSCSGTLRFRTTDVGDVFRKCRDCGEQSSQTIQASNGQPAAPVPRRVSIAQCCAPLDDTDHEISHLSDLPNENDHKSPRAPLSPGEQRTPPTYTDTYTEPSDLPTLSEGEMLVPTGRRRSLGEAKDEAIEAKTDLVSVSQKMEDALLAIGEELARCRLLLQHQRQFDQRQTAEASTNCPSHVALRHSPATPLLAHSASHRNKCVFTLHIGTLVLSDEAVIYSKDKSLLLTWKFYEQNVAMTRMRNGRVVLFDFTTEYDAETDERFMDYLKYEEMTIIICELNKQNSPFASCNLPLREVLVNANHRVDMSLALNVGPDMRRSMASHSVESLVKSDEVGVLDLWCMLRTHNSQTEKRPMAHQERMDESSDDYRMSEPGKETFGPTYPISPEPRGNPLNIDASSLRSKDDPLRSQLTGDCLAKYSVRPNTVITNEVPTNIRSSGEMKKALDRNAEQNNIQPITGMAKLDEDALSTQNPQNLRSPSWTKFIRRQSRSQKKSRKSGGRTSDAFETIKRSWKPQNREFKFITPSPSYTCIDDPSELGETNKDAASKKSVTIRPKYSKLGWEQPQQDVEKTHELPKESIDVTILWLALNEECSAMTDPAVQRLYVAYSLLGRSGADLETPVSLPKPKSYIEKCVYNFKKTIHVKQCDMALLGHMGRCKSNEMIKHDPKDCIVFTVISEPAEDPLGLASCEDIGYAYLYLGDVLSSCAGSDTYTEVVAVRSALREDVVVGVLCVQLDGLELVRRAKLVSLSASFKY